MSEKTENAIVLPAAEENELILRFAKPYRFEGAEYSEVDLTGLENMSAGDLCAVGKLVARSLGATPVPELTVDYAVYMAARASGKPVEFFQRLPAKEAIKLKNLVTSFLYGGDGEE